MSDVATLERGRDFLRQHVTVGQIRQLIVLGLIDQAGLGPFPRGHVLEMDDQECGVAIGAVGDGCRQVGPDDDAVRPDIPGDDLDLAGRAGEQPSQERLGRNRVVRMHELSRRSADKLLPGPPQEAGRRLIDLDQDLAVKSPHLGDRHADGGVVKGDAEALLGLVPLADVLDLGRVRTWPVVVVADDTQMNPHPEHAPVGPDVAHLPDVPGQGAALECLEVGRAFDIVGVADPLVRHTDELVARVADHPAQHLVDALETTLQVLDRHPDGGVVECQLVPVVIGYPPGPEVAIDGRRRGRARGAIQCLRVEPPFFNHGHMTSTHRTRNLKPGRPLVEPQGGGDQSHGELLGRPQPALSMRCVN